MAAPGAFGFGRRVGGRGSERDGEAKARALPRAARDRQIATHHLGHALDEGEPEPRAAIPARDVDARLHERPEQPLDLGGRKPDAAVDDMKDELDAAASGARRLGFDLDRAALGELHRVVDQVFERGAQPHRVAGHGLGQIVGHRDLRLQAFRLRAGGKRLRQGLKQTPRPEHLFAQDETGGLGPRRIDGECRQCGQVLGAALDPERPAPLAVAKIGARQQFAERQNAGQRGTDVVRESGQRRLDRRRARRAASRCPSRRLPSRRMG